ncbi:hypothetical protein HZH68_016100 [Vespula germanica]|uniref:Uncharacterized protein n=1 Tax=Vespula germanica TaxID=30212 RepID=A0A834MQC5_VESGE|nr:hypothetical protein HZH68_016100 [Vespula germanica]
MARSQVQPSFHEATVDAKSTLNRPCKNDWSVSTITDHYINEVFNIFIKYNYCKTCESWTDMINMTEYLRRFDSYCNYCSADHRRSAEKLEVDAVREMFKRFEFSYEIMDSFSYGPSVVIKKNPCKPCSKTHGYKALR